MSIGPLLVGPSTTLLDVLATHHGAAARDLPAGIALVVDQDGRLVGTLTDGDVRRALLDGRTLDTAAGAVMQGDPILFDDELSYRQILAALPAELERRGRRSRRFLGKIILIDGERRPTRVLDYHQLWEQRVATHRHVAVVGLGYVGLTLGLVLAEEGFAVTGVDIDASVVADLRAGRPHVHELGLPELLREQLAGNFLLATAVPPHADVFVIAVGTPVRVVDGQRTPTLDHLVAATEAVAAVLRPGGLVILRSTVPLGTTRSVVVPILERRTGLRAGRDFHVAFAPERTAEGRALRELRELPQIIGGINDDSTEATAALFRELCPTIVRMESVEAAELAKLVNNSFRDLIFAFSNQVVQVAAPYDFDVVEAIRAANRAYPRDPVPLPSPGVGGPCLTKDPYILASAGPQAGLATTLFEAGRAVNESMVDFVAATILKHLEAAGKDAEQATVLLCGIAFKGQPETGDVRDSTAVALAERLRPRVARLLAHDPAVPGEVLGAYGLEPVATPLEGAAMADAVLFCNNHVSYGRLDVFELVRAISPPAVVFDGWHLFRADDVLAAAPATYIGLGFARSSAGAGGD